MKKTSRIKSGNAIINSVIYRLPLGFELPPTGSAVGIVKHINFVEAQRLLLAAIRNLK